MSQDTISVTFTCKKCGGNDLQVLPDDQSDDSLVSCKQCGFEFGRWGDVKYKASEFAANHLTDMARNALKGSKWIKIK